MSIERSGNEGGQVSEAEGFQGSVFGSKANFRGSTCPEEGSFSVNPVLSICHLIMKRFPDFV